MYIISLLEVVKNTASKTNGKIDVFAKSAIDMTVSIELIRDARDHWYRAFSKLSIDNLSWELKQIGMNMEE